VNPSCVKQLAWNRTHSIIAVQPKIAGADQKLTATRLGLIPLSFRSEAPTNAVPTTSDLDDGELGDGDFTKYSKELKAGYIRVRSES